jgi:hypothetical protein
MYIPTANEVDAHIFMIEVAFIGATLQSASPEE